MNPCGGGCCFAFVAKAFVVAALFFGPGLLLFESGAFFAEPQFLSFLLCLLLLESKAFVFEVLLFCVAAGFFDSDTFLFGALLGFDLLAAEAFFFEALLFLQPLCLDAGLFEVEESAFLLDAFSFAAPTLGFLLQWRRSGTELSRRSGWRRGRWCRTRLYGWGLLRLYRLRGCGLGFGFRL